jgi:IS4 transposase
MRETVVVNQPPRFSMPSTFVLYCVVGVARGAEDPDGHRAQVRTVLMEAIGEVGLRHRTTLTIRNRSR